MNVTSTLCAFEVANKEDKPTRLQHKTHGEWFHRLQIVWWENRRGVEVRESNEPALARLFFFIRRKYRLESCRSTLPNPHNLGKPRQICWKLDVYQSNQSLWIGSREPKIRKVHWNIYRLVDNGCRMKNQPSRLTTFRFTVDQLSLALIEKIPGRKRIILQCPPPMKILLPSFWNLKMTNDKLLACCKRLVRDAIVSTKWRRANNHLTVGYFTKVPVINRDYFYLCIQKLK